MTPFWELPFDLWRALGLTLQLAAIVTFLLLLLVLPLATWLATTRWRIAGLFEVVLALPLVLPPTVIGFYLLIGLSGQQPLGQWWQHLFGQPLVFSFAGLVIASCIYSLPFAMQPVLASFKMVRRSMIEAAYSLGMTRWQAWRHVFLPLAKSGIYAGALFSFAHTIGEFGVVLMVGGNIAGSTRLASVALYDEVQKLNYANAESFALVLLGLSVLLLGIAMYFQKREKARL